MGLEIIVLHTFLPFLLSRLLRVFNACSLRELNCKRFGNNFDDAFALNVLSKKAFKFHKSQLKAGFVFETEFNHQRTVYLNTTLH